MGQSAFIWSRTKEIVSHHQAFFTNRGSDQISSARKANYRSLSSPKGRYLLVCSSRLRQKELESRCVRLLEVMSRVRCARLTRTLALGKWRSCLDILCQSVTSRVG